MNPNEPDQLESRLEALTQPTAEPAMLWRAALEEHRATRSRMSIVKRAAPWAVLAAAILLMVPILMPVRGSARKMPAGMSGLAKQQFEERSAAGTLARSPEESKADRLSPRRDELAYEQFGARQAPASVGAFDRAAEREADSPRLIARKADMSLKVADVREAFLKAGQIISPARGEFVEDSKIAGEGPTATADLTLRVAADRLPEAMNHLRALGAVANENTSGDDVTNQAVDLDARLRNEQRVEKELLELFDTRKEAPLADVLKLQESLTTVRGSVERLDAQRTNLQRLVDLATILVILRPQDAPPPAPAPDKGFLGHLDEQATTAWRSGTYRLAHSLACLIEVGVGHLMTWVMLVVAAAIGIGVVRRFARWSLLEPAPRLNG